MSKAVSKTSAGQWEGWEAVYPKLLKYSLRLSGNRADAEDITQGALLCFKEHMEKNQREVEIENVESYLGRIAHNLYVDLCKRRKKEGEVSCDNEYDMQTRKELNLKAAAGDGSIARIEDDMHYKKLYRTLPLKVLLGGLSEYELQLLRLKKVEERSNEEIAETLNKDVYRVRCDLNKLDARLSYRRKKIRKELDDIGLIQGTRMWL